MASPSPTSGARRASRAVTELLVVVLVAETLLVQLCSGEQAPEFYQQDIDTRKLADSTHVLFSSLGYGGNVPQHVDKIHSAKNKKLIPDMYSHSRYKRTLVASDIETDRLKDLHDNYDVTTLSPRDQRQPLKERRQRNRQHRVNTDDEKLTNHESDNEVTTLSPRELRRLERRQWRRQLRRLRVESERRQREGAERGENSVQRSRNRNRGESPTDHVIQASSSRSRSRTETFLDILLRANQEPSAAGDTVVTKTEKSGHPAVNGLKDNVAQFPSFPLHSLDPPLSPSGHDSSELAHYHHTHGPAAEGTGGNAAYIDVQEYRSLRQGAYRRVNEGDGTEEEGEDEEAERRRAEESLRNRYRARELRKVRIQLNILDEIGRARPWTPLHPEEADDCDTVTAAQLQQLLPPPGGASVRSYTPRLLLAACGRPVKADETWESAPDYEWRVHFQVPPDLLTPGVNNLTSANLRIYTKGIAKGSQRPGRLKLQVYQYTRPFRHGKPERLRPLSWQQVRADHSDVIRLDVTSALAEWTQRLTSNHGLALKVIDREGNHLNPSDVIATSGCVPPNVARMCSHDPATLPATLEVLLEDTRERGRRDTAQRGRHVYTEGWNKTKGAVENMFGSENESKTLTTLSANDTTVAATLLNDKTVHPENTHETDASSTL